MLPFQSPCHLEKLEVWYTVDQNIQGERVSERANKLALGEQKKESSGVEKVRFFPSPQPLPASRLFFFRSLARSFVCSEHLERDGYLQRHTSFELIIAVF